MKQNRFRTMWVAVGMVLLSLPVGAQGLSLEECQRLAWTNYPLLKKYNLIEQTTSYSRTSTGGIYRSCLSTVRLLTSPMRQTCRTC